MVSVSPTWRNVLLDHLNQQHGISLTEDLVDFIRYHYQPSLVKRNAIVVPKDEKMFNRSMVTYEPYKPSKYFLKVPTTFFVGQSITNSQIIDLLNASFGVTFDKEIDFTPTELNTTHSLTEFPKVVTIPVAEKTSFIWTDVVTVTLHDANTLINELIKVRNLDALTYNDTVVDGKASLWLSVWPYKVTGIALLREFSRADNVVLHDDILDELLDELIVQRIINPIIRPEFRAMLDGQTIVFTDSDEGSDYNRQGVSQVLESEHYSGKLVIRLNKEDTVPIGDAVDSPIILSDIINDGDFDDRVALLKLSINTVTEPGIVSVLTARSKQRPDLLDVPLAIESIGNEQSVIERVVADMTNWVESVTINVGMSSGSTYFGGFGILSETPEFTVDDEEGLPIEAEDSTVIELEYRFVAISLNQQPALTTNPSWVNQVPFGHIPVLGTLLYESFDSDTGQYVLSPSLVVTLVETGTVYTNPLISGLEFRINHPTIKRQLDELFPGTTLDGFAL